jgi:hypothetical protein
VSVAYEDLTSNPRAELARMLTECQMGYDERDLISLAALIKPSKRGNWTAYADQRCPAQQAMKVIAASA